MEWPNDAVCVCVCVRCVWGFFYLMTERIVSLCYLSTGWAGKGGGVTLVGHSPWQCSAVLCLDLKHTHTHPHTHGQPGSCPRFKQSRGQRGAKGFRFKEGCLSTTLLHNCLSSRERERERERRSVSFRSRPCPEASRTGGVKLSVWWVYSTQCTHARTHAVREKTRGKPYL